MWVLGDSDGPPEATAPYRAGVKLPEAGWVGPGAGTLGTHLGKRSVLVHPIPRRACLRPLAPFISPVSVISGAPEGRQVLLRAERGPAETTPGPLLPLVLPAGLRGRFTLPAAPSWRASPVSHLPWVSHIAICAMICGVQVV